MWYGGSGRECFRDVQVGFVENYLESRPIRKEELLENILIDFPNGIMIADIKISHERFAGMCLNYINNGKASLE